jgi:hypothetical protein
LPTVSSGFPEPILLCVADFLFALDKNNINTARPAITHSTKKSPGVKQYTPSCSHTLLIVIYCDFNECAGNDRTRNKICRPPPIATPNSSDTQENQYNAAADANTYDPVF